jgi:hypothetical protein
MPALPATNGRLASFPGVALVCAAFVLAALGATPAKAVAAENSRSVQDAASDYTMACAIRDSVVVPEVRACAELGAAQRCGHEADFSSRPSQERTGMTIVNRSDQVLKLYWLNFSGSRQLYHTVAPGERITQLTFTGHNWLITTGDGACVGIFNASPIAIAFF